MGLCIAHGNGLSLSLLSHLTNQPLLEVYPRFLLTAVQMWRRGQDLGRSDTQPQHGVNKRQLLQCEWCWELLDKVFRTRRRLLALTSAMNETLSHVLPFPFTERGFQDFEKGGHCLHSIHLTQMNFTDWHTNMLNLVCGNNRWHVYRNGNKHHIIEQP